MPLINRLIVDKLYHTVGGSTVRIVAEIGDRFIGINDGEAPRHAFVFDQNGRTFNDQLISNIDREANPGQLAFCRLGSHDQETCRRIATAFWDKKITGIKILRGTFGMSLTEAKAVFEFLTDV